MTRNPLRQFHLMKKTNWQKLHRDLVEAEQERDTYRALYEKALQEPQALREQVKSLQEDLRNITRLYDEQRKRRVIDILFDLP